MHKRAFTLLELMIVVIIVGLLASLALPKFQGAIIQAKMAELYSAVATIEKAEEIFYYEHGYYASGHSSVPAEERPLYSIGVGEIANFRTILGMDIPGLNSVFVYGVYNKPAEIWVRIRAEYFSGGAPICHKYIEGPNEGKWVRGNNLWSRYLLIP